MLQSIDTALSLGFSPVKINCVLMKGVNDSEILDFIDFAMTRNVDVRFMEYMPFDGVPCLHPCMCMPCQVCACAGNKWSHDRFVSYTDALDRIRQRYPSIESVQTEPNATAKVCSVCIGSGDGVMR